MSVWITVRMTRAEVVQMLQYVDERDQQRWYYGNKRYFEKRHQSIKECLERALERASDGASGVTNGR